MSTLDPDALGREIAAMPKDEGLAALNAYCCNVPTGSVSSISKAQLAFNALLVTAVQKARKDFFA